MPLKSRHLLGLEQLTREEINLVLDTASSMKEILGRPIKKVPALRGKTVINLFYEASTRTRTSFELAAKHLSADSVNIATAASSVTKGESLIDTAATLRALGADAVVLRHPMAGAPHLLARKVDCAVINAGDGAHEHPTQALLDLFTIREKKGRLADLTVVITGDIAHSRVARSNIWGLSKLGARVRLCGPETLLPSGLEQLPVEKYHDFDRAIAGADVVMMLRLQLERQQQGLFPSLREYARLYGLSRQRLGLAAPDALVMHPGPINRGVEIAADVADGAQSVINEQVTNGVAVRMAVLYLLIGGGGGNESDPAGR
ncbi:MAG: aspartate carbamoyltransferase catalytic subunit [Desulfurispora sp.]|uniref:aspartate carbamoyltransferase catalytic subunit n=1 Tax=Desulfurispora sp. TaxID=3014275 RepID=UPI00404B2C45